MPFARPVERLFSAGPKGIIATCMPTNAQLLQMSEEIGNKELTMIPLEAVCQSAIPAVGIFYKVPAGWCKIEQSDLWKAAQLLPAEAVRHEARKTWTVPLLVP
jgi:hypothetical protein